MFGTGSPLYRSGSLPLRYRGDRFASGDARCKSGYIQQQIWWAAWSTIPDLELKRLAVFPFDITAPKSGASEASGYAHLRE